MPLRLKYVSRRAHHVRQFADSNIKVTRIMFETRNGISFAVGDNSETLAIIRTDLQYATRVVVVGSVRAAVWTAVVLLVV